MSGRSAQVRQLCGTACGSIRAAGVPLIDAFAEHRRVVTIDGPGCWPQQSDTPRLHSMTARQPPWRCSISSGHRGRWIESATPGAACGHHPCGRPATPTTQPGDHRRTAHLVSRRQRWTKTYPLALIYRLVGPVAYHQSAFFDTLLGPKAIAAQPDRAAQMMNAFNAADRESIRRTIRFMHHWHALTDKLPAVIVPTLLMTGDLPDQQWQPADAQAAAAAMPTARAVAVTGAGHLGPRCSIVRSIARPSASSGDHCRSGNGTSGARSMR